MVDLVRVEGEAAASALAEIAVLDQPAEAPADSARADWAIAVSVPVALARRGWAVPQAECLAAARSAAASPVARVILWGRTAARGDLPAWASPMPPRAFKRTTAVRDLWVAGPPICRILLVGLPAEWQ